MYILLANNRKLCMLATLKKNCDGELVFKDEAWSLSSTLPKYFRISDKYTRIFNMGFTHHGYPKWLDISKALGESIEHLRKKYHGKYLGITADYFRTASSSFNTKSLPNFAKPSKHKSNVATLNINIAQHANHASYGYLATIHNMITELQTAVYKFQKSTYDKPFHFTPSRAKFIQTHLRNLLILVSVASKNHILLRDIRIILLVAYRTINRYDNICNQATFYSPNNQLKSLLLIINANLNDANQISQIPFKNLKFKNQN